MRVQFFAEGIAGLAGLLAVGGICFRAGLVREIGVGADFGGPIVEVISVGGVGAELVPERIQRSGFFLGLVPGDALDEGGFGGDVVGEGLEGGLRLRAVFPALKLSAEGLGTLVLIGEEGAILDAHARRGGFEGICDLILLRALAGLERLAGLLLEGGLRLKIGVLRGELFEQGGILGLRLLIEGLLALVFGGKIGGPCLGGAVRFGERDDFPGGEALLAALGGLLGEGIELLLRGGAAGLDGLESGVDLLRARGEIGGGCFKVGLQFLRGHTGAALALALCPCGGIIAAELQIEGGGGLLLVELGGFVILREEGAGVADFGGEGFCRVVGLQVGEVFIGEIGVRLGKAGEAFLSGEGLGGGVIVHHVIPAGFVGGFSLLL